MRIDFAHQQFRIGVDKTDSLNSANFLTEEIDLYLSDAQEEFIEQRAYGLNVLGKYLEETQKRIKDLQSLEINGNLNTFTVNANNKPNGTFVTLPDGLTILDNTGVLLPNYRHPLEEEVTVLYKDCHNIVQTKRIQVIPLTHSQYNKMVVNPFSQPTLDKVYRLPYGRFNNLEHFEIIVGPGQSLITYHLRYLRNPRKINLANLPNIPNSLTNASDQLDMTDESCREIVRIAIRNALGDISSDRTAESIERLKEIE